uniref:ADAMTS cysteine-rich domain-containing protein n=1 Tax=Magallana gigas TaxID=29159 RepID=K1PLA8_MAGGI
MVPEQVVAESTVTVAEHGVVTVAGFDAVNKNDLNDVCTILYCYNTKEGKCVGYLGGDGLSCGNKKWCLSGVCTFSDYAPTKNEECMFGDDPGTFRYEFKIMTCKGVLINDKTDPKTVIEASFVCTSDESCERTSTTSNADKDDIQNCSFEFPYATIRYTAYRHYLCDQKMYPPRKHRLKPLNGQ